jgi:hypothetical protein
VGAAQAAGGGHHLRWRVRHGVPGGHRGVEGAADVDDPVTVLLAPSGDLVGEAAFERSTIGQVVGASVDDLYRW